MCFIWRAYSQVSQKIKIIFCLKTKYKKYMVWFNIFFIYTKIEKLPLHIILDLIISLLNSLELGQYFKNPNFFFWELMVTILIWILDLQVGWYLNTKSWLEKSQNYFGHSSILFGSIFTMTYKLWKTISSSMIGEPY